MYLSNLIKSAQTAINTHGDVRATILRSEGRSFIECPIKDLVVITNDAGVAISVIVDDGDLIEAMPKVNQD